MMFMTLMMMVGMMMIIMTMMMVTLVGTMMMMMMMMAMMMMIIMMLIIMMMMVMTMIRRGGQKRAPHFTLQPRRTTVYKLVPSTCRRGLAAVPVPLCGRPRQSIVYIYLFVSWRC